MDHQNWLLLGGVTLAIAVSIYLLWGPSPFPKKKSGNGEIVGLVNLGSTCFLNTLLQALASCALFVEWLDLQSSDEKVFTSALRHILWVLNGRGDGDIHSPAGLLSVLRQQGWVLPPGEQDAHELFQFIMTKLQEENSKKQAVSITDALPMSDTLSQTSELLEDPFEIVGDSNTGPSSLSVYEDALCRGDNSDSLSLPVGQEFYSASSGDDTLKESNLNKPEMEKLRSSQESIRRGLFDRSATMSPPHAPPSNAAPFQGLLASSLKCKACGVTSCVRTDTFDSVSLTLGSVGDEMGELSDRRQRSLNDLLWHFVRPEVVPDVDCEKCGRRAQAFKTYNFGKLPSCLCIHIARTAWHVNSGTSSKRTDHVDFPEYLVLDPYTWQQTPTPTAYDVSLAAARKARHLYRLKSVVVHMGNANSGHFVTFRRGPLESYVRHAPGEKAGACVDSSRWFLTSDENVKLSSFLKVRESLAYMLFYERCNIQQQIT